MRNFFTGRCSFSRITADLLEHKKGNFFQLSSEKYTKHMELTGLHHLMGVRKTQPSRSVPNGYVGEPGENEAEYSCWGSLKIPPESRRLLFEGARYWTFTLLFVNDVFCVLCSKPVYYFRCCRSSVLRTS